MPAASDRNKVKRFVVILEEPDRIVIYGTYHSLQEAESEVDNALVFAGSLNKLIDAGYTWSPIYDTDHFLIFGIKHTLRLCVPIGDFRLLVIELLEKASVDQYILIRSNYRKAIETMTVGEFFVGCN